MKHQRHGFTVVELIVVITVIGVLAGIVLLSVNGWRQRTESNKVQSDLNAAAAAMEDYRNNNSGYPTNLPSTFTATSGVNVSYTSGSAADYCVNANSATMPGVAYNIQSTGGVPAPKPGTCS